MSYQMLVGAFNAYDALKSFANLYHHMALDTDDPMERARHAEASRAYRHAANLINDKLDLRLAEQDAALQEG